MSKAPDWKYDLEYQSGNSPDGELRKFVRNQNVELLTFAFTKNLREEEETESEKVAWSLNEILNDQYPETRDHVFLIPMFILALPGQKRLIIFPDPWVASSDIMAAVLSNGEILDGDEYKRIR